jgi:hypothetical protein
MAAATVNQIYAFPSTFIENIAVLADGTLLLSTLDSEGLLFTLDPNEPNPEPKPLGSFGDATGLSGIVPLDDDLVAVSGGVHSTFAFERGSMKVFIVSIKTRSVVDTIPFPDTAVMNGMTALPGSPTKLVSADSQDGRILLIDTVSKEVSVLIDDDALRPIAGAFPPIGINGVRSKDDYLYYTNSAKGTFGRFRVGDGGKEIGEAEILAKSPGMEEIYDDFIFDNNGNAYVAAHSTSVVKIPPGGQHTTLAGGGSDTLFKEPTSVALSNDGKSIYVCTGGARGPEPKVGGQVIQIQI